MFWSVNLRGLELPTASHHHFLCADPTMAEAQHGSLGVGKLEGLAERSMMMVLHDTPDQRLDLTQRAGSFPAVQPLDKILLAAGSSVDIARRRRAGV